MKKLDKITLSLFWTNFVFTALLINMIVVYIGLITPSSKEFILNAPVPKKYQWIELKTPTFENKNLSQYDSSPKECILNESVSPKYKYVSLKYPNLK
jgi:hypothetical protein